MSSFDDIDSSDDDIDVDDDELFLCVLSVDIPRVSAGSPMDSRKVGGLVLDVNDDASGGGDDITLS